MVDAQIIGKPKRKAPPIVLRGSHRAALLHGGEDGPPPLPRRDQIKYDPLLADEVLWLVAMGQSVRDIARMPGMPDESTIRYWSFADIDGFFPRYTRAKRGQMDVLVDSILDIANDQTAEPNDRRVRIDAIKWLASKFYPERFGDKLQVSGDPENPLRVVHESVNIEKLTVVELEAIELLQLARLQATDIEEAGANVGQDGETPQKA